MLVGAMEQNKLWWRNVGEGAFAVVSYNLLRERLADEMTTEKHEGE